MGTSGHIAERVALRVSSPSHRVEVRAEDRSDIEVRGAAEVHDEGAVVTVGRVRGRLSIRVPEGTDVLIGSEGGRVTVRGPVGEAAITTTAGRIEVESARSVDIRSRSGRVEIGESGDALVRSASGRVSIGRCATADLSTDSGRIDVSSAGGEVRAHCVSGRIDLTMSTAANVDAESVSGRISVELPEGTAVHRPDDESDEIPDDCDCRVRARSVSGRVDVSS